MNPDATRSRILRRAIAVTIAVVSIAAASLAAPAPAVDAEETAVVGILHPMAPIGNIDCCH